MYRIMLVVCCLVSGACGSSSPAAPSPVLTGSWAGGAGVAPSGTAAVRMTLAQAGPALSGSWSLTFGADTDNGAVTGTLSDTNVSMTLQSNRPGGCPYLVSATLTGTTMAGTYATFNCPQPFSGPFTLTKQ